MARYSRITLIWVKGHGETIGNNTADILAKAGTRMTILDIDQFCGVPLAVIKKQILDYCFISAQERWSQEHTCSIARLLWPRMDSHKTSYILGLNRIYLSALLSVLTGHSKFGNHARRIGIPYNDFCRSCQNEEEEETITHFLCNCPALESLRHQALGSSHFSDLSDLSAVQLGCILAFLKLSKWVCN